MTIKDFKRGYTTFQRNERRDAIYNTASLLIKTFWNKPEQVANGLGVLLLVWNNAFYRYGLFDFALLGKVFQKNKKIILRFRSKSILSYTERDNENIRKIYDKFLDALKITCGNKAGYKSHVATAKALHLLAPSFFPLWDAKIAKAYKCQYDYISFMKKMYESAIQLNEHFKSLRSKKTLLKLIDEYNYSKFTKGWI